jgi:hypothetical protein
VVHTRRRLMFENWEIILQYGTNDHPHLESFTLDVDAENF